MKLGHHAIERVFARSQIHLCPDIKDPDESGRFVPLGQGVLDAAGVIGALRDDDFQGWPTVETDGWEGDPSAGARTSRADLETLLGGE